MPIESNEYLPRTEGETQVLTSQLDMLKQHLANPLEFRNFLIMIMLWVTVAFDFYLMGFYLSNMEGDVNTNSLFQGIGMIIAFAISGTLIEKIGKQQAFRVFFGICVISSALYVLVPNKSPLFIAILAFMGRLGICPCYSLTFLCSNQLFPANLKTSMMLYVILWLGVYVSWLLL